MAVMRWTALRVATCRASLGGLLLPDAAAADAAPPLNEPISVSVDPLNFRAGQQARRRHGGRCPSRALSSHQPRQLDRQGHARRQGGHRATTAPCGYFLAELERVSVDAAGADDLAQPRANPRRRRLVVGSGGHHAVPC